jgi:hypothetical protein
MPLALHRLVLSQGQTPIHPGSIQWGNVNVILTQIVSTVLMLELGALDLSARIERISRATATQELSACFAPIKDQPQRLIDIAKSTKLSGHRYTAADKIPSSSMTLQVGS